MASNGPKPSATPKARLATANELRKTTFTTYFDPPPSLKTIGRFLRAARVPRIKANPLAKRGGGTVFYHVAAVERAIRERAGLAGAADYNR